MNSEGKGEKGTEPDKDEVKNEEDDKNPPDSLPGNSSEVTSTSVTVVQSDDDDDDDDVDEQAEATPSVLRNLKGKYKGSDSDSEDSVEVIDLVSSDEEEEDTLN